MRRMTVRDPDARLATRRWPITPGRLAKGRAQKAGAPCDIENDGLHYRLKFELDVYQTIVE